MSNEALRQSLLSLHGVPVGGTQAVELFIGVINLGLLVLIWRWVKDEYRD